MTARKKNLCLRCCYAALACTLTLGTACAHETSDPFSNRLPERYACGEINTDRALDLAGVVHNVLCNNPQTREVWANSRAQAAQTGVSQASYLPAISATGTGTQNTPGVTQRTLGLTLSYLLYDFGARAANLDNARQLLASLNASRDSTVQTVFLSAVLAYYQAQAARAAQDAAAAAERAAQESFALANARYLAGSATPADMLTAQTAYSQSTLNRITAIGAMKIARGNLASLLGLDAHVNILLSEARPSLPVQDTGYAELEQNITAMIEEARHNRPDLKAAEATLRAAEAAADAARAAGKPTVSLNASGNQSSSAGINTHGSSLGVSMNVPLFSGYAPTYRIRAAEAQIDSKKAQLERLRLQVALDVWTACQNLITATRNLHATADLVGSAEQSERMALGRYRAGTGIMLDVLNAQNSLYSANQQRIQAEFNWNISRATLAQAMGNLNEGVNPGDDAIYNTIKHEK
ncbi:MAG: transporter [Gallionellales bacterium RIFOXYB12_FULL_54_9]|nr:MAG: transporter [Gallionellales bacterium RIFOXYB12_FULL_54_9]